jgi:DNA-binding MarR family transcriptional regulator
MLSSDRRADNPLVVLKLLESVQQSEKLSQRRLAAELNIALGLVNAYVKRCVKKGLVKVTKVPTRRYAYYLTPQGFSEKSRLTVEYLSASFSFFRAARAHCAEALSGASARGWTCVALAGISDLAEISIICALESNVEIVAVVDGTKDRLRFIGRPVVPSFDAIAGRCDAVLITELNKPDEVYSAAVQCFGADRVLIPALLSGRLIDPGGPT